MNKSEKLWVTYTVQDEKYFITSNADRTTYYLYHQMDGKTEKIARAKSPVDLEKRIGGM